MSRIKYNLLTIPWHTRRMDEDQLFLRSDDPPSPQKRSATNRDFMEQIAKLRRDLARYAFVILFVGGNRDRGGSRLSGATYMRLVKMFVTAILGALAASAAARPSFLGVMEI